MSGAGDVIDWGADFINQSSYDLGIADLVGDDSESPNERKARKATEKAAREKKAARGRIKPIPDVGNKRTEMRKESSRKRAARGGRVSTLLSSRETLG